MLRNQILLTCVLSVAVAGHGQAAPESAPVAKLPSSSPLPPPVTFHSDLLDLSFAYPNSMVAEMLPSLKEQHDAIAAREPADIKPESRKMDECSDRALVAARADDLAKAGNTVTKKGDKGGASAPTHAVNAKITISRIGVECMPAAYQSQVDDVATSMSAALARDRDLRPIDQPIWYEISGARIHFAAGESAAAENPSAAASDPNAKPRWVGSAAFVWHGNLVSIVIESNDLAFFNAMLHGKVTLGANKTAPLFAAEIGKGKPIEIKPDVAPE
jgi:hypothetical protein